MIWESSYWKDDLLRQASVLRQRMEKGHWTEGTSAEAEKIIFFGFYAIRKLLEAEKISTRFKMLSIPIKTYPSTGKPVTRQNNHKVDELYRFDAPAKGIIRLPDLANQAIHSYIFVPGFTRKGKFSFILLCSDRQRVHGLHHISVRRIIRVFEQVGRNYPHTMRSVFDPKIGDYRVHSI